jgi:hypothetical protein
MSIRDQRRKLNAKPMYSPVLPLNALRGSQPSSQVPRNFRVTKTGALGFEPDFARLVKDGNCVGTALRAIVILGVTTISPLHLHCIHRGLERARLSPICPQRNSTRRVVRVGFGSVRSAHQRSCLLGPEHLRKKMWRAYWAGKVHYGNGITVSACHPSAADVTMNVKPRLKNDGTV